MLVSDLELTTAPVNREEAQDPISNPHKHPRLLTMDQKGEKGLDLLLGGVKPWHIAGSLLNMPVQRTNLTLLSL